MTGNLNSKGTGSGGCGCGGGGGSTALVSTCSCGGKGCSLCYTSAFVRPNFFAGQLLTEDDLQQLGEYVVAKNRLHNKFLFGDGVVCGLEVTCDPCGNGGVTVNPGYALDCCGNDLTLACPTTLDINSMVRELRRSTLGADCGDPCAESKVEAPKEDPASYVSVPGKDDLEPIADKPTRHFCLYIRYCEQATDPVAPYSTGEPCGASACETTRVREGVSFELRCEKDEKPRIDIFTRIRACFGDLEKIYRYARQIDYHNSFTRSAREAVASINANEALPFDASHIREMEAATRKLNYAIDRIERPSTTASKASTAEAAPSSAPGSEKPAEADVRSALDAALNASSVVARLYSRDTAEREKLTEELKLHSRLTAAHEAITRARETFDIQPIDEILTTPLERESARALVDLSGKLNPDAPLAADEVDIQVLARGAVFNPTLLRVSTNSLESMRDWLLSRMDASPHLTDCDLRRDLARLVLPSPQPEVKGIGAIGYRDAAMTKLGGATSTLQSIFLRYLRDCLCGAINPVCSPCDDPAVLLACIEVRDCEVVRICSLERTFVLSPTAMRYWLPPLSLLGEGLEKICCADIEQLFRKVGLTGRSIDRQLRAYESAGATATAAVSGVLRQVSRLDTQKIGSVAGVVTGLFREADLTGSSFETRPFSALGGFETGAFDRNAIRAAADSVALSGDLGRVVMDKITEMVDKRVEVKLAAIREEAAASQPAATAPANAKKAKDTGKDATPAPPADEDKK